MGKEINRSAWPCGDVYCGGSDGIALPKAVGEGFSEEMTFELCFEGGAVVQL